MLGNININTHKIKYGKPYKTSLQTFTAPFSISTSCFAHLFFFTPFYVLHTFFFFWHHFLCFACICVPLSVLHTFSYHNLAYIFVPSSVFCILYRITVCFCIFSLHPTGISPIKKICSTSLLP